MQRWIGRVALVTGASAGIGEQIYKALLWHGINVIGCGRNLEYTKGCDLSRESEILSMFKEISKQYGRIDICINNTGFNLPRTTLLDGLTEEWRRMLDVNVLSPLICTREAIKLMGKENKEGQVINISSLYDREMPKNSHDKHFFCGTMSMVTALTKGLRQEVKPNIRVSCISPGLVKTNFVDNCWGSEMPNIMCRDNTYLSPNDVVDAVLYILKSPPHLEVPELLVQDVKKRTS